MDKNLRCYEVRLYGIVQGVGYRPYIYNQAKLHGINGYVTNEGSSVLMAVEASKKAVGKFLISVVKQPPSLAKIEKVDIKLKDYECFSDFIIRESRKSSTEIKFISADTATCPLCLVEIQDPQNHRYRYAFTNCTACGPRYSIIKSLPYDRVNTTMQSFKMCPSCQKEYADSKHRRFHAQPNCCPSCGPQLCLLNNEGEAINCSDPINEVITLLKQGKIIAIKGLGGFHLACDGKNASAIAALRKRKNRPHKPLALMVKDLEEAKTLCQINTKEIELLTSSKAPIVLLEKHNPCLIPEEVAPKLKTLGIMLPYTPLHHLLFQEGITTLIMTSGNVSNSPICYENTQALTELKDIADYFLIHNRDINIPVEDSVVKVVDGKEAVVRRGRGYSPLALPIGESTEILALGAEEKSSFALSQNSYGYMSQYLGDLKNPLCFLTYLKTLDNQKSLLCFEPKVIAADLQSSYNSSKYGASLEGTKIAVQHHHAHMASCMAEHRLTSAVIGVIFDGTGVGTDKKVWGGEFLVGDRAGFKRAGHLRYTGIQGGDMAIKEPWRVAASYLYSLGLDAESLLPLQYKSSLKVLKKALEQGINCFDSSSVGRLFDCASSLLNIRHFISYEGQAAIELENLTDNEVSASYPFDIYKEDNMYILDYKEIILGILKDKELSLPLPIISSKFHNALGEATIELVAKISKEENIFTAVLSGGVFENKYLLTYILKGLSSIGIKAYFNQQVPINDGGLSFGQLAAAAAMEGR